jgi:hypothetical protein
LEEDGEAISKLLRLIEESEDDEVFFKQFIPSLPLPVIEQLHESNRGAFHHMVKAFDRYATVHIRSVICDPGCPRVASRLASAPGSNRRVLCAGLDDCGTAVNSSSGVVPSE